MARHNKVAGIRGRRFARVAGSRWSRQCGASSRSRRSTEMSQPTETGHVLPEPGEPDEPTRVPLAIEDWLTVIVMALLALITFANVLVRYFTDQSFAWTEEFSVFLMIVLAMVAGSAAVARNANIRIEFFADSGSPARQRALARFGALMVFVLFALMAVLSARIGVPQWWYTVWLPVLSVAIAGRALGLFLRRGRRP